MIEFTRETIAYAIIVAILVAAVPIGMILVERRRRGKLRRRGIKTFGH